MQTSRNAPCPCGSGRKYKVCCLAKDEAARKPHTGEDAVLVLMPTRGTICYETHLALTNNLRGVKHGVCMVARKPVVEARNTLARYALEQAKANPFDFTPRETFALWIDDDAWWVPETVPIMLKAMRELPALDALFGRFSTRLPYSSVIAFRDADDDNSFPKESVDCQPSEIVPIEDGGFHFVLMRISLLERIGPNPFDIPAGEQCSEDRAFCRRAVAIGAKLGVGMGFPIVHVDPKDGVGYLPGMPPMLVDGNAVHAMSINHAGPDGHTKTAEEREYGADLRTTEAYAHADRIREEREREVEQRRAVSAGGGKR